METMRTFIGGWGNAPKSLKMVTLFMKLKYAFSLEKTYDQARQYIIKQTKVSLVKAMYRDENWT